MAPQAQLRRLAFRHVHRSHDILHLARAETQACEEPRALIAALRVSLRALQQPTSGRPESPRRKRRHLHRL